MNDFNFVAPYYDFLSKLIFGGQILSSQTYFFDHLKEMTDVLIIGGGTGELLKHLPKDVNVCYLEKSKRMIQSAKKKSSSPDITFIQQDFFEFKPDQKYDTVICPFFLDCFNEQLLQGAIQKIKEQLIPKGLLIVSDFDDEAISIFLSKTMHLFFGLVVALQAKKLQPIRKVLYKENFIEISGQQFKKGIFSAVYKKRE